MNYLFPILFLFLVTSCAGPEKNWYENKLLTMEDIKTVRILGLNNSCLKKFGKEAAQNKCQNVGYDKRNRHLVSWFMACNDLCIGDEFRLVYLGAQSEKACKKVGGIPMDGNSYRPGYWYCAVPEQQAKLLRSAQ